MSAAANDKTLRPTLLIGLGGTGKQVLLNLRRMFYDQFGEPTLPHIAHLWIDTDASNRTIDGSEMDFLLKEVDFEAAEKQSTQLQAADIESIYEHPDAYPHIFSWFDESLKKHGLITDGAGQIRSFGRLSFFRHYEAIKKKILERLESVRKASDHNTLMQKHNIHLDPSGAIDVWLVFSIAGGTGSGMFLDMAFALRHLNKGLRVNAIMVLPSVFSNDTSAPIFGNAYAALMELEHYTYAKGGDGKGKFPAHWTRDMFDKNVTLQGPVFDATYLIGNEPRSARGALTLDNKNALCEMLAEILFVEYSGAVSGLSSSWKQVRSNLTKAVTSIVRHTQTAGDLTITDEFSCRYSSVGLAKLHVPINRIANVIRHKLAADLLTYWSKDRDLPTSLGDQIEKEFYPALRLATRTGTGRGGAAAPFITDLSGGGGPQPQLVDMIRDLVRRQRQGFLNRSSNPRIDAEVLDWLQNEVMAGQLECTHALRDKWGVVSRQLFSQHTEALEQRVKAAIDDMLVSILATPDRGFAFAREALRRVADRLRDQQADFAKRAGALRAKGQNRYRDVQVRLGWLGECRGAFTRRAIIDVVLDLIEERAADEARAQICEAASEVSQHLLDHIGSGSKSKDAEGREIVVETGLVKQLSELQRVLAREVASQLDDRLTALRRFPTSPLNVSLADESDLVTFYVTERGRPIDQGMLGEYSHRFFEEGAGKEASSLWSMRAKLRDKGTRQFLDNLLVFAKRQTPHLNQQTADVIERLFRRYQDDEAAYRAAISSIVGFGHPWLSNANHFINPGISQQFLEQRMWCAWQPQPGSDAHEKFQEGVKAGLDMPLQFADCSPDKVYVTSEMAGFPLTIIPDLDKYRDNAYIPGLQNGDVLHTDYRYEKFQDLLVRDAKELEAYIRALELVAEGILTGALKGEIAQEKGRKQGAVQFYFEERRGLRPVRRSLGAFALAVRLLSQESHEDWRATIANEIRSRKNSFTDDDMARWYALLNWTEGENAAESPAFIQVLKGLGDRLIERHPHIAEEAGNHLDRILDWSVPNPPGSSYRSMKVEA